MAGDLNSSTGPRQWNTEKASNQKYTVSALYLKVGQVKTTEPYLQIVHINTIQAPLTLSNLVSFDQEPLAATRKHAAKDNDYIKWLFKSRFSLSWLWHSALAVCVSGSMCVCVCVACISLLCPKTSCVYTQTAKPPPPPRTHSSLLTNGSYCSWIKASCWVHYSLSLSMKCASNIHKHTCI